MPLFGGDVKAWVLFWGKRGKRFRFRAFASFAICSWLEWLKFFYLQCPCSACKPLAFHVLFEGERVDYKFHIAASKISGQISGKQLCIWVYDIDIAVEIYPGRVNALSPVLDFLYLVKEQVGFTWSSGNAPCQFLIKREGHAILGIGKGFKVERYKVFSEIPIFISSSLTRSSMTDFSDLRRPVRTLTGSLPIKGRILLIYSSRSSLIISTPLIFNFVSYNWQNFLHEKTLTLGVAGNVSFLRPSWRRFLKKVLRFWQSGLFVFRRFSCSCPIGVCSWSVILNTVNIKTITWLHQKNRIAKNLLYVRTYVRINFNQALLRKIFSGSFDFFLWFGRI